MGTWTYAYDDFNRLTGGSATAGVDSGLSLGWTYDRYGNRWAQNATGTGSASAVQPQLTFANSNQVVGWTYDADGNLLYDGRNTYAYDAEGRLITLNGEPTYLYDAEGRRVAKYSGSTITAQYLLDLSGEQVTELNSSGGWVHSNVFAGGKLLATYEGPAGTASVGYHFHLTDWLGTNRVQTNASGDSEETCTSYPFGDGLSCSGTAADATEQHFTGKERDSESGLDYFFARYYSSDLGRFMTPDFYPEPTEIPYANLGDPQSLNLYSYVHNDPINGVDADGHDGQIPFNTGCGVQTSSCIDPTEGATNAAYAMSGAYETAAMNSWDNLPSVEQDALGYGDGGFLDWEGLGPSGWAYVAGAMDSYLDSVGWIPIEVGQRGLKAWHGFLGLAGHSYILDPRGGHQWEVLGDPGMGGGAQANQQVRDTGPNSLVPSDSARASQPGNEVTEWLTPEQYAVLTAQATFFLSNPCPSCGANYRLTQYNSNTFVFNMLSQIDVRPPAASYIAPGYSQQGGAWYGH